MVLHGTASPDSPCNIICSVPFPFASLSFCPCSLFHNKGFTPEWDFLLWELHVISYEESFRVLSLPVGNDASIELDDRWQSAGKHRETQSARRESQTDSHHQKLCGTPLTPGESCQEAYTQVPLRERASSKQFLQAHSKPGIFIFHM